MNSKLITATATAFFMTATAAFSSPQECSVPQSVKIMAAGYDQGEAFIEIDGANGPIRLLREDAPDSLIGVAARRITDEEIRQLISVEDIVSLSERLKRIDRAAEERFAKFNVQHPGVERPDLIGIKVQLDDTIIFGSKEIIAYMASDDLDEDTIIKTSTDGILGTLLGKVSIDLIDVAMFVQFTDAVYSLFPYSMKDVLPPQTVHTARVCAMRL